MIVRCGRCRAELEISGPGEFVCPACGTRNVARGGAAADPYGIPGGAPAPGLTIPGGGPAAPPGGGVPGGAPAGTSAGPASDVRWGSCPSCGFRFAMGEVERLTCPNCRTELVRGPEDVLSAAE